MGLILFILIGVVAEILVWILVGDLVGSGWYVFFWFIAAFFIGLNLVRSSMSQVMPQMQQMQMGQMNNSPDASKHMVKVIAGFLLMLPGLISDVVALLVMIPAVQNAFRAAAMNAMQKRQQAMMEKMMNGGMGGAAGDPNNPFADMIRQMQEMQRQQMGGQASNDPTIIDGEAREVQPEQKRIESKDQD